MLPELNRRDFLIGLAAGTGMAVGLRLATPHVAPSAPVELPPKPDAWSLLPPAARIKHLERRIKDPIVPKPPIGQEASLFNDQLMISAVSEYVATFYGTRADKLIQSIAFVTPDDIIAAKEVDFGPDTPQQREGAKKTLAFTTLGDKVLINQPELAHVVEEFRKIPDLSTFDARGFVLKLVLLHELSHVHQFEDRYVLERPVEMEVFKDGIGTKVQYTSIEGLIFKGINDRGETEEIIGSAEAFTEHAARILAKQTAAYAALNDGYEIGQKVFEKVLTRARISDSDFIQYYTGKKPLGELARRIAAINPSANLSEREGYTVLAIIGQSSQVTTEFRSYFKPGDAEGLIEFMLRTKVF